MKNRNNFYYRWGKRFFDIVLTIAVLIVLTPLMAFIALLVRLNLGNPIIYRQIRPGIHGKLFTCYKFRTMTDERDVNGNLLSPQKRLTPFGRILRSTSLDELPELWNILKGDMSLVGPRPLLVEYLKLYTPEQSRRHLVLPGLTGWAQVRGRNILNWEEKFEFDTWYVDHQSLSLDMRILVLTLWRVIKCEGISPRDRTIMPRFTGTKTRPSHDD
jgi:sugar transferase EpsL